MSLYEYNKQQNDTKDMFSKDGEVEAMRTFVDKMKILQTEKKEVTTKRVRKALL